MFQKISIMITWIFFILPIFSLAQSQIDSQKDCISEKGGTNQWMGRWLWLSSNIEKGLHSVPGMWTNNSISFIYRETLF